MAGAPWVQLLFLDSDTYMLNDKLYDPLPNTHTKYIHNGDVGTR